MLYKSIVILFHIEVFMGTKKVSCYFRDDIKSYVKKYFMSLKSSKYITILKFINIAYNTWILPLRVQDESL